MNNQKTETSVKVENLPMDLNVNELQAQGGYVTTFLNEHTMIMAALTNPTISVQNTMVTATMAIRLKVSLITDDKIREDLWQWYDTELDNRIKALKNNNISVEEEHKIQYDVAIVLLGKIMSFVGKHLSKPIEIGTE